MENLEVLKSSRGVDVSGVSGGDGCEHFSGILKENENLGRDLLEDLDSYMDDITGRLTVARMVSDSVIKGTVNAIEQDARDKIEMKELEVDKLRKTLSYYGYHEGTDESESNGSPIWCSASTDFVELGSVKAHLGNLRVTAKEQFNKLEKEINSVRGCGSIRGIYSGSKPYGLDDILHEKDNGKLISAEKFLSSLKTMLHSIDNQVDKIVYMYDRSLQYRQQEQQFQEEIEAMVVCSLIQSLQGEFERRMWDQSAHFYDSGNTKRLENMKEISVLRRELDAISKSISLSETGLASQGSFEMGGKADIFHGKALLGDTKGINGTNSIVPENFEVAQLLHMSKEDIVTYFKDRMTEMKRGHESKVQEMTEEYFRLKREYFKERGYSLQLKKDKEFDALRTKIPEIISNLDSILAENEKLSAVSGYVESFDSLKNRLDNLYWDNCSLRKLLIEKKKEIKYLSSSSRMFDATKKPSELSVHEANLLSVIENLKDSIEDSHIESSIVEDVCKCVLWEATNQIKLSGELSAACSAENASQCYAEDLSVQSTVMQELLGVIFREAIQDAKEEVSILNLKLRNENDLRVSIEMKISEREEALDLAFKEKERAEQEILLLESEKEEKEKMLVHVMAALEVEKKQLDDAKCELNKWKDLAGQKQLLISENDKELNAVKETLEQYKKEMIRLNQKLEIVTNELNEMGEERRMLLSVHKDRQDTALLFNAKIREEKNLMDSLTSIVHGLSKEVTDFEFRIAEDLEIKSWRLENASSQLNTLVKKVNKLRRTALLYKGKFETRSSDLQKAEAEVDLLGDEVEVLFNLLEKIYIALDHYAPILQHYPGIVEILKLVKRKLSGESDKSAQY